MERSLSRLEASWRGLEAQGGPRALQETSRRPKERSKRPQGGPKSAPGGLKTAPRALQEAPRALQEASRRLQEAPSRLQERSKRPQERFKRPSSPLQRLLTLKWLRPQFSRVFSSILEPGDLLGSSPNGSRRLEEACWRPGAGSRGLLGGFEWPQERSEVASGRVKWLRVASRALEEPPETTATQRNPSQGNSKVLSTASSID